MIATKGYAAKDAKSALAPFNFERREVGDNDVLIEILYSGVCHSDIHQARDEWGGTIFPIVPGHEIVGRVSKVGSNVKKFKIGDLAGVGCMVDSCRKCKSCEESLEQYCNSTVYTYNSMDKEGKPTYGGYADNIVTDEKFCLKVSEKLDLKRVAPLLCAGITTWSPLRQWKIGKGHKLAVLGLGGLGHMAVKLGASLGAEVTVLSTSPSKEADAKKLGASDFVLTNKDDAGEKLAGRFDFIINTVSAAGDLNFYINMLRVDGTMILLGIPPEDPRIHTGNLVFKRRRLAGSLIGGIKETQEMLDYCAEHNIVSDVEIINMDYINTAYDRMMKGDVKYRFVIDMESIRN